MERSHNFGDHPETIANTPYTFDTKTKLSNNSLLPSASFPGLVCTKVNEPNGKSDLQICTAANNVYTITPANLFKYMQTGANRTKLAIVDLRQTIVSDQQTKSATTQIKGAIHLPLATGMVFQLHRGEKPSKDVFATGGFLKSARPLRDVFPFPELAPMHGVVFHCEQSAERTPAVAAVYAYGLARERNQLVFILQGGFNEVEKTAHAPIEPWSPNALKSQREWSDKYLKPFQ